MIEKKSVVTMNTEFYISLQTCGKTFSQRCDGPFTELLNRLCLLGGLVGWLTICGRVNHLSR